MHALETYTCTVYVNPNGTSKNESDLQKVTLKTGNTETIEAGYHVLEFQDPIEIKSNDFAVVIKIQGTGSKISLGVEIKYSGSSYTKNVTIENNKCFYSTEEEFKNNVWVDCSKTSSNLSFDTTVKAFTVAKVEDDSLKNIEVATKPNRTAYFVGENFDKTGMVIKANYNNGKSNIIVGYNITNGTNLQEGQNITISYEDKTINLPITVEKNTVEELKIKTPPTKTTYKAGHAFEKAGMVIEATYKDGTVKNVTDYTIKDGSNLKNGQTTVTICFGEKEVKQEITVETNPLVKIEITKAPNKTKYVEGQNFEKDGMKIIGTYEDGLQTEIIDYEIIGGTNLQEGTTSVTISFEDQRVTQDISVEKKAVESIKVIQKPDKIKYVKDKDSLDLTGGKIEATYNDGDKEEIQMSDNSVTISGFDNSTVGNITLTITYKNKTTTLSIEIIEEIINNSDISNGKCVVKNFKMYTYTDPEKQEYALIDIIVNNITRNFENDKYEYYYYLSINSQEQSITNWVKINEEQKSNDISFRIDTHSISNYSELKEAQNIYLYIKEVAIKGGSQKSVTSNAMLVTSSKNGEIYLDDAKIEKVNQSNQAEQISNDDKKDYTTSKNVIPNTGTTIAIMLVCIIIVATGVYGFIRVRKMKEI